MPIFSDFTQKNIYCHAHILSKNVQSLKTTLFPWPYFVKKTSILSKTRCSHVFLKFFMKNPLLSCPSKNVISVKTTLYYEPKRRQKALFPIFHEKIIALMPIFCKIISSLYKPHYSHVHILSKKQIFSQKHCTLMPFSFNFFM